MHIEATKLKEAGFTEHECTGMIDEMEKHAKGSGDPFLIAPYMLRCVPFTLAPRSRSTPTRNLQPHSARVQEHLAFNGMGTAKGRSALRVGS